MNESPEKFAHDAGYQDGLGGHRANARGFAEGRLTELYQAGFREGRQRLWVSVRNLIRHEGTEALRTYLDE